MDSGGRGVWELAFDYTNKVKSPGANKILPIYIYTHRLVNTFFFYTSRTRLHRAFRFRWRGEEKIVCHKKKNDELNV